MIAHWCGWRSINCGATMAKAVSPVGHMFVQQDVERENGAAVLV